MERLKNNIMLIVLSIVIICCTISVNKKLEDVSRQMENLNYNTMLGWINDLYDVLLNIEGAVENTDKKIKNIDLMLDWALDDIVYYISK